MKNTFLKKFNASKICKNVPSGSINKKLLLLAGMFIVGIILIIFSSRNKKNLSNGGVIINTNKSFYSKNEKVSISIISIDENGKSVCDAKLKVSVTGPNKYKTELSTENGTILNSATCGKSEASSSSNDPDYNTYFVPSMEGAYTIKLFSPDSNDRDSLTIQVKEDLPYSVERLGAVKTDSNNPGNHRYHMTLRVVAKEDFNGVLLETVPAAINLVWKGPAEDSEKNGVRTLAWDAQMKAGETIDFLYDYTFSNMTNVANKPGFIEFGKAALVENGKNVFEELNVWKIVLTTL